MGMKVIVLSVTMLAVGTLAQCQGRLNNNMVASILQDILSPANTQSALQLIKRAAAGANRQIPAPERATIPARIVTQPVETTMPVRIMPTEIRPRACIANGIEPPMIMPRLEIMPVRNDRMPTPIMPTVNNPFSSNMAQLMQQPVIEPYQMRSPGMPCANHDISTIFPARTSSLVSPYLPAASPVSAFAPPASNMLPPPTQARNQYLRKVPIPPPTL